MSATVTCTAEHDQDFAELCFPNGHWYIMPNYQAIIPGSGEDEEKRARLFAAASDLLAACKAHLAAINGKDHGRAIDEAARASEQIAAAVGKAEGRR